MKSYLAILVIVYIMRVIQDNKMHGFIMFSQNSLHFKYEGDTSLIEIVWGGFPPPKPEVFQSGSIKILW